LLGGIGFTMSLFVSTLAFDDPETTAMEKAAVLVGSFISAVIGFFVLDWSTRKASETQAEISISQPK
jgi:NhaA family Na+:H+ antiporter